jgi:hypothetical protein
MRHEIKKISRIIDEIVTFFLKKGSDEITTTIKRLEGETRITIVVSNTSLDEVFIQQLNTIMNSQRQHEVEEYYWQLAGEVDNDTELTLVGVMVDEAQIEVVDGKLQILLIRKD